MNGRLIPLAGGEPIPLTKSRMIIGRRPDCEIVLNFGNISGTHCVLNFEAGAWVIGDLGSSNGVMVNEVRVKKQRLRPNDHITIARKHHFRIEYELGGSGADFVEDKIAYVKPKDAPERPLEDDYDAIFSQSLMERSKKSRPHVDKDDKPG